MQSPERSRIPLARREAGLERGTLMRMVLADLALLERVEEHCREALGAAERDGDVAHRIASVAEIAHRLAQSKELVASELLLRGGRRARAPRRNADRREWDQTRA